VTEHPAFRSRPARGTSPGWTSAGRNAFQNLRQWVLVSVLISCLGGIAQAQIPAPAPAQCTNTDKLGTTQLRVTQQYGRALVEVTRPNAGGRKVEIEYGDESYIGQFDRDGRARMGFALTAAKNDIAIRVVEMPTITCKIDVPEFAKIYRVILRWRDPVQIDLSILEPGGRIGDQGHVTPARPNVNLSQGIGQMDVVSGAPAEGATAETSYVVRDDTTIPPDSVFGFRAEYVTRGMKPVAPYCDDNALATPAMDLIVIEKGKASTHRMGTNRARCGDAIPENRRLMVLRP